MKLMSSLALIAISVTTFSRISKIHASRTHSRPRAKPAEVQRWEGEGGGLPMGGPGPGVKVDTAAVADPDLAHDSSRERGRIGAGSGANGAAPGA